MEPSERPSARDLLSHPFILKSSEQKNLSELVSWAMDAIESYRSERAKKIREGKEFFLVTNDDSIIEINSAQISNEFVFNETGTVNYSGKR